MPISFSHMHVNTVFATMHFAINTMTILSFLVNATIIPRQNKRMYILVSVLLWAAVVVFFVFFLPFLLLLLLFLFVRQCRESKVMSWIQTNDVTNGMLIPLVSQQDASGRCTFSMTILWRGSGGKGA